MVKLSRLGATTRPRRLKSTPVVRDTLEKICDWLICQELNRPSACSRDIIGFLSFVNVYGIKEAIALAIKLHLKYRPALRTLLAKRNEPEQDCTTQSVVQGRPSSELIHTNSLAYHVVGGTGYWGTQSSGPVSFMFGYPASFGPHMSTAIVSVYTHEGFIVGADGMRRDHTRRELDLQARKIFFIEREDEVLAYAWAGATHILDSQNEPAFSFLATADEVGRSLKVADGFAEYVRAFSAEVTKRLSEAKASDKIAGYPAVRTKYGKSKMASVLLVGYFRGRPCRAQIVFSHMNQVLLVPTVRELHDGQVPIDFNIFSGSVKTYNEVEPTHFKPRSLQEAQALIRSYIQACIDNQAKFDDCKDIGGHIHIASVTPRKIEWIIPPMHEIVPFSS